MQERLRKIILASFYCVVIAATVVVTVHAATWKGGSGAIYGGVINNNEQRLHLGNFNEHLRDAALSRLQANAAVSNTFPTNLNDRIAWQNYLGFLGLIIGIMAIIGTLILLCGCWCLFARKPIYNRLLSSKTATIILLLAQFLTIGLFAVIAIGVSGGYSADFREIVRDTEILSEQALGTVTTAGTFVNEARNQSLQFLASADRNLSLSAISAPLDGLFGVIQTTIANSNDVLTELDKLGQRTTLLKLMLSSSTMSVQDFRERINKGKALIDQVDGTADSLQQSAQDVINNISNQVNEFIATAQTQVNYYADRVMEVIGTINSEASDILGDQQFKRYTRTVLQVENTRVGVTTAILALAIIVSLVGLVLALLNFKKFLVIYAWLVGIVAVLAFAIVGLHISFYVAYTDACKKNEVIIVNAANQLVSVYVPQAVLDYVNVPVPTLIHNILNCKGDQTFLTAAGFNESYVSELLNIQGYTQSMQGYLDGFNDASLFSQIRTGIDSSEEYVDQVNEIQDEYSTFISVLGFNAKIRSIKAAPTQARRYVSQMETGVRQIKQNATQMLTHAEVLVDKIVGKGVDIASCAFIGNYYADLEKRVCSSYRAMMIVILLFSLFVGLTLFSESWLLLVRSYQPPVKKVQPYPQAQYLYPTEATLSPSKPLPITGA